MRTHRARPRPPDLSRLDPGGALARAMAPERVLGAVVYSSNNLDAPGVVTNFSAGRNMLVVGEPDDRHTPRIAALRALLGAAGHAFAGRAGHPRRGVGQAAAQLRLHAVRAAGRTAERIAGGCALCARRANA